MRRRVLLTVVAGTLMTGLPAPLEAMREAGAAALG